MEWRTGHIALAVALGRVDVGDRWCHVSINRERGKQIDRPRSARRISLVEDIWLCCLAELRIGEGQKPMAYAKLPRGEFCLRQKRPPTGQYGELRRYDILQRDSSRTDNIEISIGYNGLCRYDILCR